MLILLSTNLFFAIQKIVWYTLLDVPHIHKGLTICLDSNHLPSLSLSYIQELDDLFYSFQHHPSLATKCIKLVSLVSNALYVHFPDSVFTRTYNFMLHGSSMLHINYVT